jgi:hypothetical protein
MLAARPVNFALSSKDRLTDYDLGRFPGDTLFDRVARALCGARCLPRKELYESWEVARRARRRFRGGRVVDVGGGHGLLAHLMRLLDATSTEAIVVDPALPPSASRVHEALAAAWPALATGMTFLRGHLDALRLEHTDVVVSSHACGALTDRVLDAAIAARACVAVLPCCHDVETCDAGSLQGWVNPALAIDIGRAHRLEGAGYAVWTQTIPSGITPKNRLLLGAPLTGARTPVPSEQEN